MDINKIINNITLNDHFSYVRYQDGEIIALIGYDWISKVKASENQLKL